MVSFSSVIWGAGPLTCCKRVDGIKIQHLVSQRADQFQFFVVFGDDFGNVLVDGLVQVGGDAVFGAYVGNPALVEDLPGDVAYGYASGNDQTHYQGAELRYLVQMGQGHQQLVPATGDPGPSVQDTAVQ